MNPERWQQIQELLADLLEIPEQERETSLRQRCGDDAELRDEVESLLEAASGDGLLDDLADRAGLPTGTRDVSVAEPQPPGGERSTDSVRVGETITHYRVDGVLGRGGMGEVYRATDVRLGRQVAMKVLPLALAENPEHVARFKREARLLAALNHSNIAAIYDIEESGKRKVIILELVEGPTLSDRIRETRGRGLGVDTALRIARQIAEAVEAAHDVGIVHRDLKPSNVKVAARDRIKVLDFGIAKPEWAVDAEASTTGRVEADQTEVGRVFGTAAYMSPEQARGERVDRRTDIWAYGCVFYEMLTGHRVLEATEPQAARELLENPEVDWSRLPEGLPATVRGLLERCLCADPRLRLQALGEARILLDRAIAGDGSPAEPGALPSRAGVPWWGVAAAAGLATVAGWLLRPAADVLTAPAAGRQQLQLIVHPEAGSPRISPDGRRVAYTQNERLWIYALDDLDARQVEGLERVYNPAWSPDGAELAYGHDGRLWRVALDGGRPSVVGEMPRGTTYLDWGAPDRVVLSAVEGLFAIPSGGGHAELIMARDSPEDRMIDPHSTPDGAVLFATADRNRIDAWIDDRRVTVLASEGAGFRRPHWVDGGFVVYVRAGTSPGIWAVRVDDRLRPVAAPFVAEPSTHLPTVSRTGQIAYVRRARLEGKLVRVSRDGVVTPTGSPAQTGLTNPSVLPSGREAVVVARTTGDVGKLWLHSLDAAVAPRPLTVDTDYYDRYPTASPSGHLMLYTSDYRSVRLLKLATLDRPDREMVLDRDVIRGSFSPDGRSVVYVKRDRETGAQIWIASARGDGEPRLLLADPGGGVDDPRISPDGRWIAYVGQRFNRPQVLVSGFPDGSGPWQITTGGGTEPRWSSAGDELYYTADRRLHAVPVRTDSSMFSFGEPAELFDPGSLGLRPAVYDPLPDGSGFLMIRTEASDQPAEQEAMVLVQGWQTDAAGRPAR